MSWECMNERYMDNSRPEYVWYNNKMCLEYMDRRFDVPNKPPRMDSTIHVLVTQSGDDLVVKKQNGGMNEQESFFQWVEAQVVGKGDYRDDLLDIQITTGQFTTMILKLNYKEHEWHFNPPDAVFCIVPWGGPKKGQYVHAMLPHDTKYTPWQVTDINPHDCCQVTLKSEDGWWFMNYRVTPWYPDGESRIKFTIKNTSPCGIPRRGPRRACALK